MSERIELPKPWIDRFWEKVDKGPGCWEWTGFRSRKYGRVYTGSIPGFPHNTNAHRMSWIIANEGLAIPSGMFVCHHCDNPACVRPDHLFLGDNLANMRDKVAKGRHGRGETSPLSRLTEEQVRSIRERYAAGSVFYRDLAAEYGVTITHVAHIVVGKRWKHVA